MLITVKKAMNKSMNDFLDSVLIKDLIQIERIQRRIVLANRYSRDQRFYGVLIFLDFAV